MGNIKGWKKLKKDYWIHKESKRVIFVSERPQGEGYSAYLGTPGKSVAQYIYTDNPLTRAEAVQLAITSMRESPRG